MNRFTPSLNRAKPQLSVEAMQTYAIRAPTATHFRKATCKEIDCPNYVHGWKTIVDEATELGQQQAGYIRHRSGRRFVEECELEGLTTFIFFAGEECFQEHQTRIDRPEIFLKVGGDWRAFTTPTQAMRCDDWLDDFEEHQDRLAGAIERG